MPVEIRELHIRVAVNSEPAKQSAPAKSADGDGADKEAIVAECVEQVLRVIQAKRER
jgi:Family of unknown function (DUF5908)